MWIVFKALAALFLVVCLQACGPSPAETQAVRAVFDKVRAGEFEAVEAQLAPALRTEATRATLERLRADIIPTGEPEAVSRLQWSSFATSDARTITIIDRYTWQDRILFVRTSLRYQDSEDFVIEIFNVRFYSVDEIRSRNFTFDNKPAHQIAFFVAMLGAAGFMVYIVLAVIFTKALRAKWLLIALALVGLPKFVMNWDTGVWETQITVGLLGFGVTRGFVPSDPWLMEFSLPVGAVLVLLYLISRWLAQDAADGGPEAPKPPTAS